MLKLKGASKLKSLILHPFKDKTVTIITLDEIKLSLGMESGRRGNKRLVIFANTNHGFVTVGTIYFNTYPRNGQHKGNTVFTEFDERRGTSERQRFDVEQDVSREEIKEKISYLGFDPNTIDKIWPP